MADNMLWGEFYQVFFDDYATRASVSDMDVKIEWLQDGDEWDARLTSEDGKTYRGIFGNKKQRNVGSVRGDLYTTTDGDVFMWCHWRYHEYDDEEEGIVWFYEHPEETQ